MKKLIFPLVMSGMMLLVNIGTKAQAGANTAWQPSRTMAWEGKKDNVVYLYQLDGNGKLAWTVDNDTWLVVPDKTWMDYYGNCYKIEGTDIMCNNTANPTWVLVPGRYWRGSDGVWYSLDHEWKLWTGGNGDEAPLSINGKGSPYGGTETVNQGSNSNGDKGGYQHNNGNTNSGGANSTGGYNRTNDRNTGNPNNTGTNNISPK